MVYIRYMVLGLGLFCKMGLEGWVGSFCKGDGGWVCFAKSILEDGGIPVGGGAGRNGFVLQNTVSQFIGYGYEINGFVLQKGVEQGDGFVLHGGLGGVVEVKRFDEGAVDLGVME